MIDENKLIDHLQRAASASDNTTFANGLLSAIDIVKMQHKIGEWIPCSERLPEDSETMVLVQVSGRLKNITFEDTLELASYDPDDGWILDAYPDWEYAQPTAWMPLPGSYEEV